MSIQSTQNILRKDAIRRIRTITYVLEVMDYRELEHLTYEPYHSMREFINTKSTLDVLNIDKWTDMMLEIVMDKPFYRYSIFENYLIPGET